MAFGGYCRSPNCGFPATTRNASRRSHQSAVLRHPRASARQLLGYAYVRNARATLLGVGIAIAFVVMLEAIATQIWPFMSHVDTSNETAVRAAIASAPIASMLWVLGAYAIGTFVGSFLACKMSGGINMRPSLIVGAMLLLGCVLNTFSVPQPMWMNVISILVPLPVAWLGFQLARVR